MGTIVCDNRAKCRHGSDRDEVQTYSLVDPDSDSEVKLRNSNTIKNKTSKECLSSLRVCQYTTVRVLAFRDHLPPRELAISAIIQVLKKMCCVKTHVNEGPRDRRHEFSVQVSLITVETNKYVD